MELTNKKAEKMKKVLSLLGSLNLVATSTVAVVACGSDKGDPVDPTTEIAKLIEEFLRDVELTTDSYWDTRNSSFFDISTNPSTLYSFLEEDTIKKYVDDNREGTEGAVKGDHLTANQKTYLSLDIDKILASDQMKRYFQTNIDQEKYALLIEGIDFYQGFEPDWTSLEVNYTNDEMVEGNGKEEFVSYISLNLNLNFQYLDVNGELTDFSVLKRFIFTLTSDGILVESIMNLEKNIANDYYLNGEEYSWLDADDFGYTANEDKQKIFKPDNSKFKEIYETNEEFQTNIIEFMSKNYFSQITGVPLAFTGDIIFDSFTSNDYMSANENKQEISWTTEFGLRLYNSIFSDLEHNQQIFVFGELSDVNTNLWNYLKDDYMNFYNSYNTRNITKLAEIEKAAGKSLNKDKELAFDNSIGNGLIKLKGLSINVNDSYIHPINDFSIFTSMAVKNDEVKEDREDRQQSYLFGAMYSNLELGIQTFQDIFDIKSREQATSNFPLARFTGNGISVSGDADNLWNEVTASNNQYTDKINDSLSLTGKNLTKHRDSLLDIGYQRLYNWGVWKTGVNTVMQKDDKGIIINLFYSNGDSYINWNFKQNFINVDFRVNSIWKQKGAVIFEKVTVE